MIKTIIGSVLVTLLGLNISMADQPIARPDPVSASSSTPCPFQKGQTLAIEFADGDVWDLLVVDVFVHKGQTYLMLAGEKGGTIVKWTNTLVNLKDEEEFNEVLKAYRALRNV